MVVDPILIFQKEIELALVYEIKTGGTKLINVQDLNDNSLAITCYTLLIFMYLYFKCSPFYGSFSPL